MARRAPHTLLALAGRTFKKRKVKSRRGQILNGLIFILLTRRRTQTCRQKLVSFLAPDKRTHTHIYIQITRKIAKTIFFLRCFLLKRGSPLAATPAQPQHGAGDIAQSSSRGSAHCIVGHAQDGLRLLFGTAAGHTA